MPVITISQLNAPGPQMYYHLTDAQLRARQTPDQAVFIAEGPKVVHTALDCGYRPLSLLMRQKFVEAPAGQEIIARCGDIPVYTAADEVLAALTGFRLQRAWVLCAMKRPAPLAPAAVIGGARRIAVLEDITEPSNVGAIFRSAAALGMDGVLTSPGCADPFHRRSVRVSMGSVFTLPFSASPLETALPLLRALGFLVLGMALGRDSVPLSDPALKGSDRIAMVFGTEDTGLSDSALSLCDRRVVIPMRPGIDSLNVAASAAVAFWELR